jgi:hypothetical protein
MRKVAGHLFGFMGPRKAEFAELEAADAEARAARKSRR